MGTMVTGFIAHPSGDEDFASEGKPKPSALATHPRSGNSLGRGSLHHLVRLTTWSPLRSGQNQCLRRSRVKFLVAPGFDIKAYVADYFICVLIIRKCTLKDTLVLPGGICHVETGEVIEAGKWHMVPHKRVLPSAQCEFYGHCK